MNMLNSELLEDGWNLMDPHYFCTGMPHAVWRKMRQSDQIFWHSAPYGSGFWSIVICEWSPPGSN